MSNEDDSISRAFHSDPPSSPNTISGPAQRSREPIFPAELLDSGFEWTEILTAEQKH
jgi:hypothetical protein